MKKINFKNLGKQFGLNFLRNRLSDSDPDDDRGFHRKNVDAAKYVAKDMAKDYLKKKIMLFLSPIIAKILLVIIIIIVILLPVSYVYMMFMNAFKDWDDKFLQGTTVIAQEFTDWINGGKDTDKALAARELSYQEYLVKRFMQLQNQITKDSIDAENGATDEDDMKQTDINELKTRAIMWVYGRIYTEYFQPSVNNHYFGFYSEHAENSQAPALKGLQETAETIYTPVAEGNVYEARKRGFNDSINVYDIMAFDYLAGTLFDLLDLDLELMNQRVREKHQADIDKTIKEKRLEVHQKYADKVLTVYRNFIVNSIGHGTTDAYPSNTVSKTTEADFIALGMNSLDLFKGNTMKDAHAVHMFIEENFSFSSSEDTKWLLNSLTKLDILDDKKLCENNDSIGEHLIKHEYQYNKLLNVRSDLQNNIYLNYVLSFAKDDTQYNLLKNRTLDVIKAHSTDKKMKKIKKDLNEDLAKVEFDATTEVINKELKEMMEDTIKDLNLTRTQEAALSYRNYLTELEQVTTIAYHSLDLDYSVFDEFYKIPKYSVEIASKYANGKTKFADLLNQTWYPKRIKDKSELVSNITESTDKYYFDANSNPIVFANDEQSNHNFYKGYSKLYIEKFISLINTLRNELSVVQTSFNSAKQSILSGSNPTEEQKAIISEMQNGYWETLKEAFAAWESTDYFIYETTSDRNPTNYVSILRNQVNNKKFPFYGDLWNDILQSEYEGSGYANTTNGLITSKLEAFASSKGYNYKDSAMNKYYTDYNSARKFFLESYDIICMINGKPTIKGKPASDFFNKADEYFAKEYERLDELEAKIKALQDYEISNAPQGLFYPSNLSSISLNGRYVEVNSDYIKNNVLQVMKYKYTQEEAIKLTAQLHYQDVLRTYKVSSPSFNSGMVVNLGDLEVGSSTVPGGERYAAYQAASAWLPLAQEIAAENGNVVDPNLLVAMIATESTGDQYRENKDSNGNTVAVGLMQIEYVHWGKTVTLPSGKKITLNKDALLSDARLNIEAGLWEAKARLDDAKGNICAAIVGYNMGKSGLDRIVFLYLVDKGELSMSDWNKRDAVGAQPNAKKLREAIDNVLVSGNLDWLNYRAAYQQEKWFGSAVGTLNHLEKVLSVYNPSEGLLSGDITLNDSDESNPYHKNMRLILWKEYYTSNDTFKNLDKWATEKLSALSNVEGNLDKPLIRPTNTYSNDIKDVISSVAKSKESKLISTDLTVQQLQTLIATSMNAGVYHPSKDSNCTLSAGFKIIMPIRENIEFIANDIADKYIDIYKSIGGKDKEFAVYLYVTNSSEESMMEIKDETGSFVQFVRNNHAEDAESFTTVNDNYLKTAQILSGDLNVDVNKFYGLSNSNSGTSSDSTSSNSVVNPIDEFYKDWLEAKFNMHEIYNASTEEQRATNPGAFPALPTMKEYLENTIDFGAIDDNVEGALTITTPDGKKYTFALEKNFLSMVDRSRLIDKVEAIVIHDTANSMPTATADSFYDKMNSTDAKETMHYVVDDKKAIHYIENNVQANHINDLTDDSTGTRGDISNSNSVGIQFAVNVDRNKDRTFWHTVALTKYLMKELNVSNYDNVILHNDVTGVEDSAYMLKNNKEEWIKFKDALQKSTVSFDNLSSLDLWRKSIAQVAIEQIGKKYVYGASGPDSFDCSGLTQYAYANNTHEPISIGRDTIAQVGDKTEGMIIFSKSASGGTKLSSNVLEPGDLLFEGDEKSPSHVMIWVGDGKYVHAANPEKGVLEGTDLSRVTVVKRIVISAYVSGKFPFFAQGDPKWASKPYYDSTHTVKTSGCGVTAMAMLINGLTPNISAFDYNKDGIVTPDEMALYSKNKGTYVYDVGTDGPGLAKNVAKDAGLTYYGTTSSLTELKNHLKQGRVALGSYSSGYWTSGGHIIAIVGINNNDQVVVYDSAISSLEATHWKGVRKNGPQTDTNMMSGLNSFIVIGQ